MKYSELNKEELIKRKKNLTIITATLALLIIVLFVQQGYHTLNNEHSSLLAVPFALSTIVIVNITNIKKLQKEIDARL